MARTALTDNQVWQLLQSGDDVSAAELSVRLGIKRSTVFATLWRLRKHGWTCRVSYGICRYCGNAFTRQGHKASRRHYHPECYLDNKRETSKPREQVRWKNLSAREQAGVIARGHRHTAAWQELTKERAVNRMKRW